ncbi:MAG: RluA family pseudouridine synthase [Hyphomonas sp.]|uniref:RluA family pseudouridine synthase n=1 Tax=Hyphomonas sp. TaxID=87 RepID=UPI0035285BBD
MTRNRPVPAIDPADAAFVRSLLIHEDNSVLVFNKPSGLAVQGGGGIEASLDSLLAAFAKSNGKRPRLVHRLDQGTSGVVIAARTQPAAARLSDEFATRRAKKVYLALVRGTLPEAASGVIDAPLVKVEEGGRPRMLVAAPGRKGAQTATTSWTILASSGDVALIRAEPETGRMHQIRAHMSHLGCPILGDRLYGRGEKGAARLMLHATSLTIRHPEGKEMTFTAPPPGDFIQRAQELGLGPIA